MANYLLKSGTRKVNIGYFLGTHFHSCFYPVQLFLRLVFQLRGLVSIKRDSYWCSLCVLRFQMQHFRFLFYWILLNDSLNSLMFVQGYSISYSVLYTFYIAKTCLYNFDPLKPHFYIVKLGFTGVYIIFLISAQKHRLLVLVRTASPRRFKRVPTIYVLIRNMLIIEIFYLKIFIFWW